MRRRVLALAFCVVAFCLDGLAAAQTIQDSVNKENIDQAESYVADLSATFSDLPVRWAARQRREMLQQTRITSKRFREVLRDDQPISLPVRIEIQSVVNPNEELDCVNVIVWKFGKKDVPDSVFSDPNTKAKIVEPVFD